MLRGTTWNLRKRVPVRYSEVEPRKELWLSLHTDSKAEAKAPQLGAPRSRLGKRVWQVSRKMPRSGFRQRRIWLGRAVFSGRP
ncbi:DUF6538 domain-containing protein [Rhodovulum sulfidophilum]|uniref:DUF6538 domain-containing protein n=1 Tax=Rhodovulum sulfidophilum TaxID=35806 RepID=UPI00398C36BE